MWKTARAPAPAKLNLHLELGRRRADGFHELESVFQALSFSDELRIAVRGDGEIAIHGSFNFPAPENIVFRALASFMEATGFRGGFDAWIEKRIPMGAGLGGGSSDAAAALRAANALLGEPLGREELSAIGLSLGSDVPFFLGPPASIARGRGERIRSLQARSDLFCVLVDPGIHVSTKEAFAWFDGEDQPSPVWRDDASLEAGYRKDPSAWDFRNSFFPLVSRRHPELRDIRERLLREGASFAALSGSGSCVYGIFGSAPLAEDAARLMEEGGWRAWQAFLLAQEVDIILE